MSTDDKVLEDLSMPPSAVEALAKAFPDDVVKAIVADTTSAPRERRAWSMRSWSGLGRSRVASGGLEIYLRLSLRPQRPAQ
jgi:hypothetical protein